MVSTIHATENGRNRGIYNDLQRYINSVEWWLTYQSCKVIVNSEYMQREIINIFQEDVANLNIGNNITFYEPTSGREIQKTLPQFDYIVSNLPFVKG